MNEPRTARHAVPEAAAELEQFNAVASSCNAMADRLTGWLADGELMETLARGYRAGSWLTEYPRGAESSSDMLNTLRNVRDALRDAASMMADD